MVGIKEQGAGAKAHAHMHMHTWRIRRREEYWRMCLVGSCGLVVDNQGAATRVRTCCIARPYPMPRRTRVRTLADHGCLKFGTPGALHTSGQLQAES